VEFGITEYYDPGPIPHKGIVKTPTYPAMCRFTHVALSHQQMGFLVAMITGGTFKLFTCVLSYFKKL